ncbi:hypothetical protein [Thaumasiovibrio subtropicus]|uniref:hypothetical protein n=1 Tax=Thaumasiovibrio subtropicus TaxID=1891207 RepID=UPI000B35BDA1|nr:hypothetical protein [Thaumasiovibrio subtropicus]
MAKQTWLSNITNLCPYKHIFQLVKTAIKERKMPQSARSGFMIAMLGLFCPLFWIALFTGASGKELLFHATHSGLVISIGLVIMVQGLLKEHEKG